MAEVLNVYVPAPQSQLHGVITPGSGIVGHVPPATGLVLRDYKGNMNGASNLATMDDCVRHAAGRHRSCTRPRRARGSTRPRSPRSARSTPTTGSWYSTRSASANGKADISQAADEVLWRDR